MNQEIDLLEHLIRFLEQENRALKQTLWDEYFKAALAGGTLNHGAVTGVKAAAEVADNAMKIRAERGVMKS